MENVTTSLDPMPSEDETKAEEQPADFTQMWRPHHLIFATITKTLVNTSRRFGYTYTPFLSEYMGISVEYFAIVLSLTELSSLLLPIIGPLSDHFGHVRSIIASLGITALGLFVSGFGKESYALLMIGFILITIGFYAISPSVQAELSEKTPKHLIGRYTGIVEFSWAASSFIGIPLMGQMFTHLNPRVGFFVLGGIIAPMGLLTHMILPHTKRHHQHKVADPHPSQESDEVLTVTLEDPVDIAVPPPLTRQEKLKVMFSGIKELLTDVHSVSLLFFGLCLNLTNALLFAVYALWFEDTFATTVSQLGIITIAIGGAEIVGSGSTALFADRVGIQKFITITMTFNTIGYLLLSFVGNIHVSTGIICLFICFIGYESSVVSSFSMWPMMAPNNSGTFISLAWLAMGIGRAIGAVIVVQSWEFTRNFALGRIFGVGMLCLIVNAAGLAALVFGLKKKIS